ncbi:ubiquinone biosynthesis monooxygenase COQ6 [Kwoniella shandongensis]|uniref:Ubiquinone biosynthesis monooxygenase COQ6, mitochondrial n=1 Tax=Kwoniella shandongensis TaxID=1734106 RepID=A0A5M6C0F1_9TREE|nr:ubiquinone biosynthesis monooxygenase COQ6 [Kwoniella shandongensis]KAA5527502.1 ubiquinone biosynthesis monooxygenase COQ6 [Kwoniella shandongensis]
MRATTSTIAQASRRATASRSAGRLSLPAQSASVGPSRCLHIGTSRSSTASSSLLAQQSSCTKSLAQPRFAIGIRGHATSSSTPIEEVEPIPAISEENTYDVVIIGGANAGLAFACALLSQPTIAKTTRILLLEGASLDRTRSWSGKGDWENRVSSLTAENVAWLDSIGVWKHIEQDRSCPVDEMVIWANPSESSTPTIHFPPLGRPMARMTENLNLQRALLRRIEEVGKGVVTIKENSKVAEMRLGEGGRWVGLRIGDAWLRGSLVVGADGPNSPVRHFSKIESYGHAYQTHAVVCTLNHFASSLYPNTTAFQRFLPTGPLAFLPLSGEASTMVWSTSPENAAALKRLAPEALVGMVNAGFTLPESTLMALVEKMLEADRQGVPLTSDQISSLIATLPSPPLSTDQPILPPNVTSIPAKSIASFPLRLTHADVYLGPRTALVGDAAHTIHPLAGQGLNMGLADVKSLSEVLERARALGGDLGSQTSLADYPRERYPLNHLMLSTTDKLHYIFRARGGLVNWIRGTGLDVINELGPIKKILMGGAGAGTLGVGGGKRTDEQREFGRANATDELPPIGGWPMTAAKGVEGWFALKGVMGMVGSVVKEGAKMGVGKAASLIAKK